MRIAKPSGTYYPKIRVAYTQIVTISTDNILKTNEFRDSVGAQWTFLSDADCKIAKDRGIQEYTERRHAIGGTAVLDLPAAGTTAVDVPDRP